METHDVTNDDGSHLGTITPATAEDAQWLLRKPMKGKDNRSKWVWLRLANGDLILGTYPQGDTYEELTQLRLKGSI